MSKGYAFTSFGSDIDVHTDTLYEWTKKHPEFKEAKHKAFKLAQKFFEGRMMAKLDENNVKSKNIDTSLVIFALKTRFHETYGDKSKDDSQAQETPIQIDAQDLGA